MAKLNVRMVLLPVAVVVCGLLSGWHPESVADEATKEKEATKKDLKQLQGTWRCVGLELNGKRIEGADYSAVFGPNPIEIKGNKLTLVGLKKLKKPIVCTFTLDPTKSPKWIDSTRDSDGLKLFGIYELKGHRLMIYQTGGKRPTEFRTKARSNHVFHIYEKVID